MAATASIPHLYETAIDWEDTSDRERFVLKEFISRIVGYPCKIACKECDGVAEVYVMSDKSGRIEDWIEIHDNGAIWPIEEIYAEKRRRLRESVSAACNAYNDEHGLEVPDCDDEEDDAAPDEDEESSSEESMTIDEEDGAGDNDEEDDDDENAI